MPRRCLITLEIPNVLIWRTFLGACSFSWQCTDGRARYEEDTRDGEERWRQLCAFLQLISGFGRFADAENVRTQMD